MALNLIPINPCVEVMGEDFGESLKVSGKVVIEKIGAWIRVSFLVTSILTPINPYGGCG